MLRSGTEVYRRIEKDAVESEAECRLAGIGRKWVNMAEAVRQMNTIGRHRETKPRAQRTELDQGQEPQRAGGDQRNRRMMKRRA
jgi:hypothetical protein